MAAKKYRKPVIAGYDIAGLQMMLVYDYRNPSVQTMQGRVKEEEIESMHARIEEIEMKALRAQVRLAKQLEEVRRSFRAELVVPYRGGRELVRVADIRAPFRASSPRRTDAA